MRRAQYIRERPEVLFERQRRYSCETQDRVAGTLKFAGGDRLEPTNG